MNTFILIVAVLALASLVGAYTWERVKVRMANSWRRLSAADEQLLAYACPDPFPVEQLEVCS